MRAVLATTAIVAAAPAPAGAATLKTEEFDSFAAGTAITTQVAGVSFPESPQTFTPVHTTTYTPPRALRMPAHCDGYPCPNGAYRMTINFTDAVSAVGLRVGNDDETCFEFCPQPRLIGYSGPNATGTIVADSLASGPRPNPAAGGAYGPIATNISATAAGGFVIRSARVYMGKEDSAPGAVQSTPTRVQIDDLRWIAPDPGDPPPTPTPTLPDPPTVTIADPVTGSTTDRTNAFVSGTVSAPGGLVSRCMTVDAPDAIPADCAGSDHPGEFRDYASGLTVGPHQFTVWARDAYGQVGHATVAITVASNLGVDIGIDLMEPIQVVQRYALPTLLPEPRTTPGIAYAHRQAAYTGVPLMRDKLTFVQLHAIRHARGHGGLFIPPAFLHGFSVGAGGGLTPLPGNPLRPTVSPATVLDSGPSTPSLARRRATTSDAYQFELPTSWTHDTVLLVGEINVPGLPQSRSECATCLADNAYAMQLTFTGAGTVEVYPLWLIAPGMRLPGTLAPRFTPPYSAFARLNQIAPFRVNVHPYAAAVNVADLAARPDAGSDDVMRAVIDRVQATKDTIGLPDNTIGLHDGRFRGVARINALAGFLDIVAENAAEAGVNRPLTSVGHELTHLLGAHHAGTACPDDGDPSSWPPDEMGFIGGWGMDLTGARGSTGLAGPGPVGVFGRTAAGLFDPPTAHADFDYMSYCVTDLSTPETDAWQSVRRWAGQFGAGARRRAARSTQPGKVADTLRVVFTTAADGSVVIDDTTRGPGRTIVPATPGPLTAVLRDAAGRTLGTAAVITFSEHIDGGIDKRTLQRFIATLPVGSGTPAKVDIARDGAVIATKTASAHVPQVNLLSPTPGAAEPVRGALNVRWRATDADGDPLSARIDLSSDGGHTWRAVATGLTGASAKIAPSLLRRTSNGRIRVVVEDGFLQAAALSGRLRIDGVGPQVVITAPAAGAAAAADAIFNLAGQAFDDAGRELRGRALQWRSGPRTLGRGAAITVPAYAVGRSITLVATDRFGRRGQATVRVKVNAVTPVFSRFDVPAKLAPTARGLTLILAASVPGRVTISGTGIRTAKAKVDPVPHAITLRVRGSAPLKLRIALRAGGRRVKVTRTVARS